MTDVAEPTVPVEATASDHAEDAVALVQHPLQHEWTMWCDSPSKAKTQQSWSELLKKVVDFSTVEDFWGMYNNIVPCSSLVVGSNYHLFKKGIKPEWEDDQNRAGGKWVATFKLPDIARLDELWLNTLLALVGEQMCDDGDVTGAVVSLRKSLQRISIWTRTAQSREICERIGQRLRDVLGLTLKQPIGYQVHSDAIKKNTSFSNRDKYTLPKA